MSKTTWGTSYFVSRQAAIAYYTPYENNDRSDAIEAVWHKLEEGEIHIGVPHLKTGETLSIIDGGLRYAITSEEEA